MGLKHNDVCSSAVVTCGWTVKHYEAVKATSEPYADSVPLSFVPLHYCLDLCFASQHQAASCFVHLPPLVSLSLCSNIYFLSCTIVAPANVFWLIWKLKRVEILEGQRLKIQFDSIQFILLV